jgi:Tol biopolymer transport system component
VDESSGQVQGDPQPITTSSEWSALPSLSRDGRRLVYATNSSRSFVEQVPLDPQTGQAAGPPSLAYQGARAVRSCDVSPDGAWLVLRVSSPADDLLLIRPDGSDLRQLTNDLARDRTPQWSPDGGKILFASNRSGKYEAWTIRPDGSGLTQLTHLPDQPVLFPFWAPDGRHIGLTYGSRGTALLDLSKPRSSPRVLPPLEDGQLAGLSWSADGRFLTGMVLRPDQSVVSGVVLWSLADNTLRRLTSEGEDPMFSTGGTRILFLEAGTVQLVDVASREVRTVLSPPPHSLYISARAGRGGRNLCAVRSTSEGDIWSLSLVEPAGLP